MAQVITFLSQCSTAFLSQHGPVVLTIFHHVLLRPGMAWEEELREHFNAIDGLPLPDAGHKVMMMMVVMMMMMTMMMMVKMKSNR